ncbi:MAG: tetratricopeptide repeat protein [Sandaracinaceae bacterium]|nr:tetratricopeptide repeat protein [Sandaracinaceae bacterium]
MDRGLELYGRGLVADAVGLWRDVLVDDPANVRARDYLEAAGHQTSTFQVTPEAGESAEAQTSWRAEVIELVRQRNFEGALARLYAERRISPRDAEITASIQRLKEHRLHALAGAIGGLDRVPLRSELHPPRTLEHAVVARLVDDVASADDIARSSPLGRVRTLEVLLDLTHTELPPSTGPLWVGEMRQQLERARAEGEAHTPPPVASQPTPVASQPAPSIAPAHVSAPTPAPSAPPESGFDVAFRQGMEAYMARRFDEAEQLFERCLALRPDDARASVNLQRLRARRRA